MRYLIAAILMLGSLSARAEMPMEVLSTANDTVGRRLVYAVKEQIRSSSSMSLTFDESKARMQTVIVTLEQDRQNPGVSTVYSIVVTWNNPDQPFPFYITQYTGFCGASRIDSCANDIMSGLSEESDKIIRLFTNATQR